MAKPLLVRTDRSPAKKIPLSGSTGGIPIPVTIAVQLLVHTVPEGYRDELYIWWNNIDAAVDGGILLEVGGAAGTLIELAPFRETVPVGTGLVIEARTGDVEIDALAITEGGVLWGHVLRSAIES